MDNENKQKFLDAQREKQRVFRESLHKDLDSLIFRQLDEKKSFFRYIITLAGVVATGVLTIFPYLGLFLYLLLIIFVVLYTKEILDKDLNGLNAQRDEYLYILDQEAAIMDDFEKSSETFTEFGYQGKILSNPNFEKMQQDLKRDKEERAQRVQSDEVRYLDYSGEFFVLLFLLASIFVIFSFVNSSLWHLFFVVVVLIFVTFTDTVSWVLERFGGIANFTRKFLIGK